MEEYKVYIQALNGVPQDDWAFTAYLGFKNRGMKVFLREEIETVIPSKYNIIIASITNTYAYFKAIGIIPPVPLNIPPSILHYAKRSVAVMTLKEFKRTTNKFPVFVKPYNKSTDFPSGVITKPSSLNELFHEIPDETEVLTSEFLDIVSEYRGFVVDGVLKAIHFYGGGFKAYPDVSIIEQAVVDYVHQPCGYSIDFGVTADGQTVLIECNDGWSLGSYGCDSQLYCRLLLKRWMELTK